MERYFMLNSTPKENIGGKFLETGFGHDFLETTGKSQVTLKNTHKNRLRKRQT